MTHYYLKDTTAFNDEKSAEFMASTYPFAIVRRVGFYFHVCELGTEKGPDPQAPFELTPLEHEALEAKRLFGAKVVVGVDPASPDGDWSAKVDLTDGELYEQTFYGLQVFDASSIGELTAGVLQFKTAEEHLHTEIDLGAGELRFFDTPGHKKLNDEEASKVAAIKQRGQDFIELIESMRRTISVPDCSFPERLHFPDDRHARKLDLAQEKVEEAIMWAIKYITAGE